MALFSMSVQQIKRSQGRSVIAAAAYRAGEKLHDDRQDMTHDYSRKGGVVHTELMFPTDAPAWVQGITREQFWNKVDGWEKRKDAQTAREIRIMIPREFSPDDRITIIRDYVQRVFVARGMCVDLCVHCPKGSDGEDQPHAHILLTMRPLSAEGFGPKSRHDWVPDPSGRTHPDGRPVMVESNSQSWNSAEFYEKGCRAEWERTANAALERIGSAERIDRRTLLARGLARIPEPYIGVALRLSSLKDHMRERFGQFQMAKHYQAVEKRAKAAFHIEAEPAAALIARAEARAAAPRRVEMPAQRVNRFMAWIERQIGRLPLAPSERRTSHDHGQVEQAHALTKRPPPPELER